jgi:hypothetical protein
MLTPSKRFAGPWPIILHWVEAAMTFGEACAEWRAKSTLYFTVRKLAEF